MASQKELEYYLHQLRRIEQHREKYCEKNVRKIYKELLTNLKEFLGVEYSNLAEDDKLTYEILQSKGQYARFLDEVERRINTFTPQAAKEIKDTVELTYKASYDGMVKAIEQSATTESLKENLKGLKNVTPEVIKKAIQNPISGLTLSDTLEKNRKEIIYSIKQQIGIGLSQGDRMSTMARRISEQVDMDYRKATRIVRTETHRVREAGYQDCAEEINKALSDSDFVMVKTWRTMKDERVRPQRPAYKRKAGVKPRKKFTAGNRSYLNGPNHVKMEGQTVLVDEFFDLGDGVKAKAPGQSGVAGHDINCRCYASKDIITRAEYEKLTGKKIKSEKSSVFKDGKLSEQQEQDLLYEKEYAILQKKDLKTWAADNPYNMKKDNVKAEAKYLEAKKEIYGSYVGKFQSYGINEDLRNDIKLDEMSPWKKRAIDALDEAIQSDRFKNDTIVYRFVGDNYLESLFGGTSVTNIENAIGNVYKEKAYLSTSVMNSHPVFFDYPAMMTIKCDKGINCFPTTNSSEGEIILGRNSKYMIEKVIDHSNSPIVTKKGEYRGLEIVVKILKG